MKPLLHSATRCRANNFLYTISLECPRLFCSRRDRGKHQLKSTGNPRHSVSLQYIFPAPKEPTIGQVTAAGLQKGTGDVASALPAGAGGVPLLGVESRMGGLMPHQAVPEPEGLFASRQEYSFSLTWTAWCLCRSFLRPKLFSHSWHPRDVFSQKGPFRFLLKIFLFWDSSWVKHMGTFPLAKAPTFQEGSGGFPKLPSCSC